MNKIPYKVRLGVGVGLFLWSIFAIIATVIFSQQGLGVWVLIVGPILAAISFILFVIIMPKTNEDGSSIVFKKKTNTIKSKTYKSKKQKKPFMTDKEWKEQEEEDDEMIFIEEVIEDD